MDNKYGLGSAKVATERVTPESQSLRHKTPQTQILICKFCQSNSLYLCSTMQDHRCNSCGEWQQDIPQGYSTGRSSDY
jgi:hypothetical protein